MTNFEQDNQALKKFTDDCPKRSSKYSTPQKIFEKLTNLGLTVLVKVLKLLK